MNVKYVLAFVGGLVAGGSAVAIFLKKKFNRELAGVQAQVSAIKARVNEIDVAFDSRGKTPDQILASLKQKVEKEEYAKRVAKIGYIHEIKPSTDWPYGYDLKGNPIMPDSDFHEEEPDPEEEVEEGEDLDPDEVDPDTEDLAEIPGITLDELDLAKTKSREEAWDLQVKKIINISDSEFFETEVDFEKLAFAYYPNTGIYLNQEDEEVTSPEIFIGNGLLFFGLRSGDPDVVYIRNIELQTDIEVTRVKE